MASLNVEEKENLPLSTLPIKWSLRPLIRGTGYKFGLLKPRESGRGEPPHRSLKDDVSP